MSGNASLIYQIMYKTIFNKREVVVFKRFLNKGYALFSYLGREVIIGTLSVATLSQAKADSISTQTYRIGADTLISMQRELEEVSITGARAPLTQRQQSRMVTVLSREEIQAAPVQSVNDLLKYVAGVDVRQRGPMGAQTDISVRGGNYEQIDVLLNGISIRDPQTGHNSFDFPVDKSAIERIEILSGPAARVYGASSLLGAINIVTRMPSKSGLDANLGAGSYGTLGLGARGNIVSGRWNNALSASYARSDGYLRNAAGKLNTDFKTAKAFYQGQYQDDWVTARWHAGVSVKDFGSNNFYSLSSDDQFEHTLKTYVALVAETKVGGLRLRPSVYWNHNEDRWELYRDQPERYPFNYHRSDVYGVGVNAYFDWAAGRTAFAADLRDEDLVSTSLGEPLDNPRPIHGTDLSYTRGLNRANVQLALEHNFFWRGLALSAGFTAVENSWANMGMKIYPGIDAAYRISDRWKVYASANSSLRMPSATELYYSQKGHAADKHLRPEELWALEVGARYAADGMEMDVKGFHNQYTDLIDWIDDGTVDEAGDAVWKSVNFGKIKAWGMEANLNLGLRALLPGQQWLESFSASYCYMSQNHREQAGIRSLYVLEYLRHKFTANLQMAPLKRLLVGLRYRLQHRVGSYVDYLGVTHSYGTYGVLDGRVAWQAGQWDAYVDMNNLLAKRYVDIGNVEQPGRYFMAGLAIHL